MEPKEMNNEAVSWVGRYEHGLTFRHRIKSRLLFAGIIRLPYSTRFQDKG